MIDSFRDRLKKIRCDLGMTQKDFGLAGGVLQQAQYKYESGKRTPDLEYLQLISINLNIDLNYLCNGSIKLDNLDLNIDEIDLIESYRLLIPDQKEMLKALIPKGSEGQ